MSVRRSSRANKGVHTKRIDLTHDEPQSITNDPQSDRRTVLTNSSESENQKKKSTSFKSTKSMPSWVEIPDESVRCLVCGTTDLNYDEDEDDPHGMMIECDQCHTWQHVKCMLGSSMKKKDLPDNYKCDVCEPNNPIYSKLRRKLAYARYLKMRLPETQKDNDNDNDTDEVIEVLPSEIDAGALNDDDDDDYMEIKKKKTVNTNTNKSKNKNDHSDGDDDDDDDELSMNERDDEDIANSGKILGGIGATKKRSLQKSKNIKSPKIEKDSSKSSYFDTIRSKIVKNFESKLFELLSQPETKSLLEDKKVAELAKEWAKILENGIFLMYPNYEIEKSKYTDKARSLLTNLKISHLIPRVLKGEFTIEQLPKLSTEDMRTEEEKKKAEEVRKQALSQVILKNDMNNLPKTRLTHKGEEIVGDTDHQFDINDRRNEEVEKIKEEKEGLRRKEGSVEPEGLKSNLLSTSKLPAIVMNSSNLANYEKENTVNDEFREDYHDENDAGIESINVDVNNLLNDEDFDNILNDANMVLDKVKDSKMKKKPIKEGKNREVGLKSKPNLKRSREQEIVDFIVSGKNIWEGSMFFYEYTGNCRWNFVSSTARHVSKRRILERANRIVNESAKSNNGLSAKGRLGSAVADDYLDKIINSRDLYLFEIESSDEETANNFLNGWRYYYSASKYAVLNNTLSYVKDLYLLALSREKMIDGEEFSIVLNRFPSSDIISHLEESTNENKIYVIFVVQRDMDSVKSPHIVENDLKKKKRSKSVTFADDIHFTEANDDHNNNNGEDDDNNDNNDDDDDDYDPALSMTMSKLSGNSTPDVELASIMKNLN